MNFLKLYWDKSRELPLLFDGIRTFEWSEQHRVWLYLGEGIPWFIDFQNYDLLFEIEQ